MGTWVVINAGWYNNLVMFVVERVARGHRYLY